jgi:hypothetical protein
MWQDEAVWQDETEEAVHLNWVPILSFAGSVVCSLAIWVGLYRLVEYVVK